jgi:dethiobiotin synthetase
VTDENGCAGRFVVGTDTGVGKTVVTAAIVARCRQSGLDAVGVKPIQTGADDDAGVVADACAAVGASGAEGGAAVDASEPDVSRCFGRLDPALAPRVAAEQAGGTIDIDAIRGRCLETIAAQPATVVEGIGGLRVAITDDVEVIDLAASLGLPCVVVARPDLGTLNHTLLTVDALTERGLTVSGVLLSGYRGETVAERTNPDELRRTLDVPVATLPAIDADDPATVAAELAPALPAWALP